MIRAKMHIRLGGIAYDRGDEIPAEAIANGLHRARLLGAGLIEELPDDPQDGTDENEEAEETTEATDTPPAEDPETTYPEEKGPSDDDPDDAEAEEAERRAFLESMTKGALQELARDLELGVNQKMAKAEMVEEILAYERAQIHGLQV